MARSAVGRFMVRRAGRAARMMGSLSADQRAMPDFLIIGTQRGGTTSLFRALLQHPNFMPPRLRKGVHYFDVAYDQGSRWYRGHFPRKAQIAEKSAALGGPVLTGEASPYYMWHPAVPGRIAADLPGVTLIALLRDPVERAHSRHLHAIARGLDTQPVARG